MHFSKQIYDTDYTELIQHLIKLHFNHDYETICKIIKIKYEPNKNNEQRLDERRYKLNDTPVNMYYKKGMLFLEDENPITIQKVKMDEETNFLLTTLLMITSNIIDENEILDIIIENWIEKVSTKKISEIKNETYNTFTIGKCTRPSIEVGKTSWNALLKICKNNRIVIKNGFKMSIMNYFNESYNIYMNNDLLNDRK